MTQPQKIQGANPSTRRNTRPPTNKTAVSYQQIKNSAAKFYVQAQQNKINSTFTIQRIKIPALHFGSKFDLRET